MRDKTTSVAGFETARLRVVPCVAVPETGSARERLRAELARLLTPVVLQHLPEPLQIAPSDTETDWLAARLAESQLLEVREREGAALIGLLILAQAGGAAPDIHIGYLLAEFAWGKGYATELLAGLVAARTAPARLVGGVGKDNPASARVLQKAGFSLSPELSSQETDMYVRTILGQ